jgi:tRNA(Ile)-lysidine synthase
MDIDIQPGRYVVAVSGGVDSVVLLDMLAGLPKESYAFTVAHFDHGIRAVSGDDRLFVRDLARQYNMPFVYDEGNLGSSASEATARNARYAFLYRVKDMVQARAIVTAHHEDDVLETAVLNTLRGTGRKGISALRSTDELVRPLLHIPKTEIHNYAKAHKLQWHEDATNTDVRYKRNYVRHKIIPKLTMQQRKELVGQIGLLRNLNAQIDEELLRHLETQSHPKSLDRKFFVQLPHDVSREFLAFWLRHHNIRDFDRKLLQRIVVHAKTLQPGQQIDVNTDYVIVVTKTLLTLTNRPKKLDS